MTLVEKIQCVCSSEKMKKRYASGEIDKEEFDRKKKDLE
jgi:uncharacterized membrane protein